MTDLNKLVYATRFLETKSKHIVHYRLAGNSAGIPVLVVHGGPGAGCSLSMLEFFDLKKYKIILVDQRGSGLSTPHANLENNTTQDLLDDFEAIRQKLGVDKWLLFGGSWGSTLSLAYAIQHKKHISGMILRGIFLATKREVDWIMQGARQFKLSEWQELIAPLTILERKDVLASYYAKLTDEDKSIQKTFSKKFAVWEACLSTLEHNQAMLQAFNDEAFSLALARIEAHYLINDCFFPTNDFLLANINTIQDVSLVIVQGKYDLVCPPMAAYELHQAHKNSKLILTCAGHSAFDLETKNALIKAVSEFANKK